jgi:hypothetical protein
MSGFLVFLISVGAVIGFFGLMAVVGQILDLGYSHDSDVPDITFKHFLDYYNLFPDRWDYGATNLIRYTDSNGTEHILQFKFFDYIKFKHFLTLKRKEKYNIERRNSEVAFLESVQKDIKAKRKEIESSNYKNYVSAWDAVNDIAELSRRAGCSYKDLSVPRTTDIIVRNHPLTDDEMKYAFSKHLTAFNRGKLSTYCGTLIPPTIDSFKEFCSFIKQIEVGVYNEQRQV